MHTEGERVLCEVRCTMCSVSFCVVLCLVPSGALSWSEDLQAALAEQSAGRTFNALAQVQALIREYPEVGRLRMEAATLHLSLNQFAKAEREIRHVLADPDLPEGVRINAQMLLLTVQRSARQYSGVDIDWALTGEAGYLAAWDSPWWGGRGLVGYESRSREPLNWLGRPVWLSWQAQLSGYQRQYDMLDDPFYQVDMSAGPVLRFRASRLDWSVGYLFRDSAEGPTTRVYGETSFADQWSIYAQAQGLWLDNGTRGRGAVGVTWQASAPFRLEAELSAAGVGSTSDALTAWTSAEYRRGRWRAHTGLAVPLNDDDASTNWRQGLGWQLGEQWQISASNTVPVDALAWNQTAWQAGLEWQR